MKRLICEGCGAGLKVDEIGQANVKCEYCGTYVRILGRGSELYDAENIISQIFELGVKRVRKDNLHVHYEKAKNLIEDNKMVEANELLNSILKEDPTQSRAWFYKSLLPILEQESILFGGHYVNICILSRLIKSDEITKYLAECGLTWVQRRKFMKFYRSTNFLYEQRLKFVDKAIDNASTPERKAFFEKQKAEAIKENDSKLRRRAVVNFLLLGLLVVVAVSAAVVLIIMGGDFVE